MVLQRVIFRTKFGKANEVVAAMKDMMGTISSENNVQTRILTDLSGPQFTVELETVLESLSEWERNRGELFARPDFQQSFARIMPLVESGHTEFYTIEA